ncbi:MAG: hypothetical protein HC897_13330 [Thermoanaerobaculia bacterium]|nr:hypothetical protein [Thermoanaerobaculia bacterium]
MVLLLLPSRGLAEPPRFDSVERLTVEDGLSHSTAWDVLQDRRGFLWFATANGLDRWDGNQFKVYQHEPDDPESISSNVLLRLFEDSRGDLWIGTRGRGLNRFDVAEERFERYEQTPDDPHSLLGQEVWSLMEDRSGRLWVGTDAGLNLLGPDHATFARFAHDAADPDSLAEGTVRKILEDRQGTLWIVTSETLELARYDPQRERLIPVPRPKALEGLGAASSLTAHEDQQGRLWIGTTEGLARLDQDREQLRRFDALVGKRVDEIFETRTGEIWLGTEEGVFVISVSADGEETIRQFRHRPEDPHSLSSDEILGFCEDRSGILWIASRKDITKLNRRREQFTAFRNRPGMSPSVGGQLVMAVAADARGVVWVGTQDAGLTAIDRERGTSVVYRAEPERSDRLASDKVNAVVAGPEDELWIGTNGGGLHRLEADRRTFTRWRRNAMGSNAPSDFIYCLLLDRRGHLWIGTYDEGIEHLDPATRRLERFRHDPTDPTSLSSDDVYFLYEDRRGDLWVATFGGLNRLPLGQSPEARAFTRFVRDPNDPTSLSSNNVTAVLEDGAGDFWVGTVDGLNRLDRGGGGFRRYGRKDGLADPRVVALAEGDDGEVWMSTGRGISRFDPRTETFRSYDTANGIHGSVFRIGVVSQSARGEIFFGGDGGVTAFFPKMITDDPVPPAVVVTELRLFNEPVSLRRRDPSSPLLRSIVDSPDLVLSHRQYVIGFELAALHFASPRKNRYAYRLEGFDDGWIETTPGMHFAQYTNLPAGDYIFRVKASNSDGVWNEAGTAIKVSVEPAPWRTWWAYSLYALALTGSVLALVGSYRRELRRERLVSQRLREVDKLKDEFLANTSHELRTPLYGIIGLAEAMHEAVADHKGGELPPLLREQLATIVASGRRLERLVGDVLDVASLEKPPLAGAQTARARERGAHGLRPAATPGRWQGSRFGR